ncbi:MAG TPA: hypothetical protein VFW91_02305 [Candidatus Binatia bacterium]|nr:hypothetical protein [Candidatus Binatia bacterium]
MARAVPERNQIVIRPLCVKNHQNFPCFGINFCCLPILRKHPARDRIDIMFTDRKIAGGQNSRSRAYSDEPLVSSDFRGNSASSIVDGLSTVVLEGRMAKVLSWYDNEWGYSCRVGDLATLMAEKGP